VGLHEGLRKALRDPMDYALGGIVAVFLFGYLIYALLKPEKF
jgi:K+-transporting ATPase KdpF subunit